METTASAGSASSTPSRSVLAGVLTAIVLGAVGYGVFKSSRIGTTIPPLAAGTRRARAAAGHHRLAVMAGIFIARPRSHPVGTDSRCAGLVPEVGGGDR